MNNDKKTDTRLPQALSIIQAQERAEYGKRLWKTYQGGSRNGMRRGFRRRIYSYSAGFILFTASGVQFRTQRVRNLLMTQFRAPWAGNSHLRSRLPAIAESRRSPLRSKLREQSNGTEKHLIDELQPKIFKRLR